MKQRVSFFVLLVMLVFPAFLPAQSGNRPLKLQGKEWKIIRTEHYDVIFPSAMEKEGRYVADSLEYLFPLWQDTLKPVRHHRYPVILNPDYLGNNGYVSTLPRRSIFYGTPTASFNGDWMSALAVHEGRHITQIDASDRNTMRALYILFGETVFLPVVPMWWFEGDAVMSETLLTGAGRGRDPGFTLQFKALMLEDKSFGYNKMMMGSFKDQIPDWYTFGYLMYSYIRQRYDPDAPETFFRAGSQIPLPVIGATIGMKRATGKLPRHVYREMAAEYASFWKAQVEALDQTERRIIHKESESHYSRQTGLAFLPDGSAVVASYDRDRKYRILKIREGDPEGTLLARVRPLNNLTAGGTLAAWDELALDAKYDSAFSRIVVLDTETGKRKTFRGSGRWLYPALTPDGSCLAVTEWRADYTSRLVLLDPVSGTVITETAIPDGELWCDLSWSDNGRYLVFVSNHAAGKSLKRFDRDTGKAETLIAANGENFSRPCQKGETVYYVSGYSGIDSLYELTAGGQRSQITVRPLGSYSPAVHPLTGEIWFIDYDSSLGTVVAAIPSDTLRRIPLSEVTVCREEFYLPSLSSEAGSGRYSRDQVPVGNEPVEDYSFGREGNRIDGWGLSSFGTDPLYRPEVDISLRTDNIAGTSTQRITLGYQFNEHNLFLGYTLNLRRYRPDFLIGTGSMMRNLGDDPFNESWGTVGMEWPIGESVTGGLAWNLTPGTTVTGAARINLDGEREDSILPVTHYLNGSLVYDRWSIAGLVSYSWHPLEEDLRHHFASTLVVQVPGLFARDTLSFSGGYEIQNSGDVSLVAFSRGWQPEESEHLVKAGIDYRFPLLYPDLPAGGILYFTRITGDLFYDRLWFPDSDQTRSSAGAEILFHFYPLQLPLELNIGFRFAWQMETGLPKFELTLIGIPLGLN